MKDPYNTLGVSKEATEDEIRKAYKKLAKHHHPDRFSDAGEKAKHVEIFKEVNDAYDILSDKAKRSEYDTYGATGRNPFAGANKPYTSTMDDFYRSVFGGREVQAHGDDIILECNISLEDVFNGGERSLPYRRVVLCDKCNGVGGSQSVCTACGGSGARIIRGAAMTVRTSCVPCSGTGKVVSDSCKECEFGVKGLEDKLVDFSIPKGVENNMKFAFRGAGQPITDGEPGHLYVVVTVKPHEKFGRGANGDVFYKADISYSTLVLGGNVDVPTMHGTVSLKVPAGTDTESKFKLKDQGLPRFGRPGLFGDQYVELHLTIPTKLTIEYDELIKKLAKLEKE